MALNISSPKILVSRLSSYRRTAACLLAGAVTPFSFAPFNFWLSSVLAVAVLCVCLFQTTGKQAFWRSWWFGVGLYGVGTSWVFVSIHTFGQAPFAFAVLLTALFTFLLATIFAVPFIVLGRWCSKTPLALLLALPAIWCIDEWIRTWLFTGFPWLFLGYGHINTWLAGWAPVGGVIGVSFIVALSGALFGYAWLSYSRYKTILIPAAVVVITWVGGALLTTVNWTSDYQQPVTVGIAQGNIPQEKKWDPDFVQPTIDRYLRLSEDLWKNDWVVWPEAAVPLIMNYPPHARRLDPIMDELKLKAVETHTTFITGILYYSPFEAKFYNSIIATGLGAGVYHKQRLAPFGDYVPLSDWFGPVLELFHLPHSILELGPPNQKGLQAGSAFVSPAICYEIAYPDLVSNGAMHGHALITVSNDAWFGKSIGPLQHMQIAQMRALETDRYLIRATNNGLSGIVDNKGNIIARSEQFVQTNLSAEIKLKQGATPFMRYGSGPVLWLSLMLIGLAIYLCRQLRKQTAENQNATE